MGAVGSVLGMAAEAATREDWRAGLLEVLEHRVGYDYGIVWTVGETRASVVGFDAKYFGVSQEAVYEPDLLRLVQGTLLRGGMAADREILGTRQREASPFYEDIIRPVGSRGFMNLVVPVRDERLCIIQLGRSSPRGARFEDRRSRAFLQELLPAVRLAEIAHGSPRPPAAALTAREQELVHYVTLGFTNREIALALGTSPNTVRNQLVRLFAKADVSRRSELVAWAAGRL